MSALLVKVIIISAVFALSLLVATYATLMERKFAGFFQDRYGPNRAGPFGLLQPLADAVKFFFKEEIIPDQSNKWLFILGPSLAMVTACMTSAVIPWGPDITLFGENVILQAADLNIGILYVFGVLSLGVYGIMIGGWASNNKFSLLGAIRASSQMISYELAMGLSIIAILTMSGSTSLRDIVQQQGEWNGMKWNIIFQPLGFIIFIVCAFAECNRAPFDMPECESELIGGYHTEFSSMKLGLYLFAEYVNIFVSSAIMATMFFGGYNYPGINTVAELAGANIAAILGFLVLFAKILLFIFVFMWIRWTLPRFRYDQLMRLGWTVLIPLSILNLVATGIGVLIFDK